MSKIGIEELGIAIVVSAAFVLAFFVLVVNHQRNVERDKFITSHCKEIKEVHGLFSKQYQCADGVSNVTE